MKNRFRLTILLLAFALLVSQGTIRAYAETEGAGEGGGQATQSESLSSDASLVSLKIAQAGLHPEFSSHQLTYTATVPYEVERVALTAQTNSPEATKVIRGTSDLKVGENIITVTVTAEDGSVREYRITLIRQEMPEDGSQTGGEDLPDETTAEDSGESTTPEEGEGTVPDESVPPETITIPADTKPNGGMVVETTTEASWDLVSMLTNPMTLIFLAAAIVIVFLFVIVAAIIVLREKLRGGDDDDEEDDVDDDDLDDGSKDKEESEDKEESVHKDVLASADDPIAEVPVNVSVQRVEIPLEEREMAWAAAEIEESQEDLDDDFELLLEDDDDFDFLDF